MIINHNHERFMRAFQDPRRRHNKYNGAYYYSQEICKYFIPNIKTTRNWLTIDWTGEKPFDHAIAFVHHNINIHWYKEWAGLDVVLVCGMPETVPKVAPFGKAIYLPLSVDVEYVKRFKVEKTKDTCFVGRREKRNSSVPRNVDFLEGLPRPLLLKELAQYRRAYAVDRCAIEAKILGCEVLPYGYGYGVVHSPDFWRVVDSREAAEILQKRLDEIDS